MVKRAFSALLLIYMGLYSVFSPVMLYAVSTNGVASPWTREKAEHLARKSLLGATPTIINQLFQAGSASAAVNLLFPDTLGPNRASYNTEITALTASGFDFNNETHMRNLYQLRYYRDPYEAKVKLFSLFEDIFPVNQSATISFLDIKNEQDLLYANTLGNYKTLVKQILFNNGQTGDYAEGKFLDLLDQSNQNSPNENYARELMQLFLMGEYKPGESKELGSIRNYEETDVAALAKILTGLESNSGSHIVSYNPQKHNTSTGVLFLSGSLVSNPFSSFYNSALGFLDLGGMQTPLLGNNGLTDNTIDYIFAQRSEAISLFLADRLFRFYIHGKPTRLELNGIAANIRANNFEILPSVKALLSSDILYSDTSMNGVSYKNPLELGIGTLKILHDKDPLTFDPRIYDSELLNMLNWRPYFPGSVFGRDGFDDNNKWFTAYTENQWMSFATRLASTTITGSYLLSNIVPTTSITLSGSFPISTSPLNTYSGSISIIGTGNITFGSSGNTLSYSGGNISLPQFIIQLGSGNFSIDQGNLALSGLFLTVSSGSFVYSGSTYSNFSGSFLINSVANLIRQSSVDEVITQIEDTLLSSRRLPEIVKAKIRTYATTSSTGASIAFTPQNTTTQTTKIRGIIALVFASPEFVLQTGYDALSITENTTPSPISSTNNKLVFIELSGGYDWLHGIIQKDQYPTYQTLRTNSSGTISIAPQNLTDLGNFYMNNALAYSGVSGPSLKSLYDSNNLRIFNRTGTSKHSRDHDAAQKQSTSYSNTTIYEDDGAFGHIVKSEVDGSNTISLSGKRPNIFRNGNYINIGPSGAQFTNYAPITTTEKSSQLNLFRDILTSRTYPGLTGGIFKNAAKIDTVATTSVSRGGPNGSGYGNINNFAFLRSLLATGIGKTFFIQGDGGYDTHSKQLAPSSNFDPNNIPHDLNYSIGQIMANATAFFNSVKDTQNITIVIYSEFGRTIRVNGDLGTDHGQGGGTFVITNNPTLQSNLSQKIYGNMDLLREKYDWLSVGIDYRSMYGKIFNALYGVSDSFYFTDVNRLEDNIETTAPKFTLARNEFQSGYNSNNSRLVVPFRIEDPNFNMDYGSNLEIEYGTNFANLTKLNQWYTDNYIRKPDGTYLFDIGVFSKNTPYVYRIRAVDNQFQQTVLTGSLNIPDIRIGSATGTLLSNTTDTIVNTHANRSLSGTLSLSGNTSIILANNDTGTISTITARDGISIDVGTGTTQIASITSDSGTVLWNGGYILGEVVDKKSFLSSLALSDTGTLLSTMNIEKIIKVGADTLGIQMNLNKSVILNISGITSNIPYTILRSENGINWTSIGIGTVNNGILRFSTNTFSYFALVSAVPLLIRPPIIPPVVVPPIQSSGGGGGGGGGVSISQDHCPNGDHSPSYYDGVCGTIPPPVNSGNTITPSTTNTQNTQEILSPSVILKLDALVLKITNIINIKSRNNSGQKSQYYRAVNARLLTLWQKTTLQRDKVLLEYLYNHLANISKNPLVSGNPQTSTPTKIPVVIIPTKKESINPVVPSIDVSTLGINMNHPVFMGYDFSENKRFPNKLTVVLKGFAVVIISKIDSRNLSASETDNIYEQVLLTLSQKLKTTNDIKKKKIIQYIWNRIYIEQQERKIAHY